MPELSCGLSLIFSMRPVAVPYFKFSCVIQLVCLIPSLSLFALFLLIFLTFLTVGLNDDQMHSSNDYICSDYDYTECLSLLADNPTTYFVSGF